MIPCYDVLIIDEYQDIEQEFADMLEMIKAENPSIQIVAVGDMEQKIYDKTTLNISSFIDGFLDNYERLEFTNCFRLSAPHAAMLGRVWQKRITGVNVECKVLKMGIEKVTKFIAEHGVWK